MPLISDFPKFSPNIIEYLKKNSRAEKTFLALHTRLQYRRVFFEKKCCIYVYLKKNRNFYLNCWENEGSIGMDFSKIFHPLGEQKLMKENFKSLQLWTRGWYVKLFFIEVYGLTSIIFAKIWAFLQPPNTNDWIEISVTGLCFGRDGSLPHLHRSGQKWCHSFVLR